MPKAKRSSPTLVACVDPGESKTGVVLVKFSPGILAQPWGIEPVDAVYVDNHDVLSELDRMCARELAIECATSVFGERGPKIIATERWAGRFIQGFIYMNGARDCRVHFTNQQSGAIVVTGGAANDRDKRSSLMAAYGEKSDAMKICSNVHLRDALCVGWSVLVPRGTFHSLANSEVYP